MGGKEERAISISFPRMYVYRRRTLATTLRSGSASVNAFDIEELVNVAWNAGKKATPPPPTSTTVATTTTTTTTSGGDGLAMVAHEGFPSSSSSQAALIEGEGVKKDRKDSSVTFSSSSKVPFGKG